MFNILFPSTTKDIAEQAAAKERAEILEIIESLIRGESIIITAAAPQQKHEFLSRRTVLQNLHNAIKQRGEGK